MDVDIYGNVDLEFYTFASNQTYLLLVKYPYFHPNYSPKLEKYTLEMHPVYELLFMWPHAIILLIIYCT